MEKRLKTSYTEDYKNISLHPPFLNFETMGFKGVLNRLKPWNYPLGHLIAVAGEATQGLRALISFAEDPGSILNADMAAHNCNSSSRNPGIHLVHMQNAGKILMHIK